MGQTRLLVVEDHPATARGLKNYLEAAGYEVTTAGSAAKACELGGTIEFDVLVCDLDRSEYELAPSALEGSIFRMLRQGQRVVFDLDDTGLATRLRLGSEVDMGTPGFPPAEPLREG